MTGVQSRNVGHQRRVVCFRSRQFRGIDAQVQRFASAEAFAKIALSPEVAGFGVHREAGLAGQLLIEVNP